MVTVALVDVVKQYDAMEEVTLIGYKHGPALNHVTLEIASGETLSVVGPSGCGKSTLLKVVAGLEYANAGHVYYDSYDMSEIKPQDRGVGMVFQDYALYPTMKGKGNLAYYFEQHDRSEQDMEARVQQVADRLGVDFQLLLGRLPDTLSGGEKQRVAIARCIVRDPVVFLMDEPIVNLDAKRREKTRIEIKKLLRQFSITTLYVTHDQQEAIFMGDRIAVMRSGHIEQVGTFDELYYTPANLFVATFIGTPPIAIVPVNLAGMEIRSGETTWPLPPILADYHLAGPARLGVRPADWILGREDGMELEIRHIERIPTEQAAFIHGMLPGDIPVTALAPLDIPDRPMVKVTPDWERVILFEPEGERVLHTPGVPDLFE
ncbi:ABC transporter ATP-binding protein [Dictyobacter kobayashii]|uniref:Sugar ABC transporter ATP-binding protein n=1 Tax=Dictyobacter kobayashii TaxID=2014872 RepID=A0A402ASV8_9CHLR|nr:ABC transporter ATP-binding protein [Dictyobacter kobayashii]GCE22172.1 sugar ABC transporter ATP-binding protein [Dictyobacter kobayashii]